MMCSLAEDKRQFDKRATNTGMHFELLKITTLKKNLVLMIFCTNYNFKIENWRIYWKSKLGIYLPDTPSIGHSYSFLKCSTDK